MTNTEALLTLVCKLPEIELQEFLEGLDDHLNRNNMTHLRLPSSEKDIRDAVNDEMADEMDEVKDKLEKAEDKVSDLEERISEALDLLDGIEDLEDIDKVINALKP